MNVRSLNVMLLTVGAVEVQYEMKKDSHRCYLLVGYYLVTAALSFYFSQYLLDQGFAYN